MNATPTPAVSPRRLWFRMVRLATHSSLPSVGPWHLADGMYGVCGVKARGATPDREMFAGLPHGYGPGTVCGDCTRKVTQ